MSFFRDLDDRLVPKLAEKADAVARLVPKKAPPSGPLPVIMRLRRVDDRWTARGPLALLREVPQLGALLVALLLVGGTGTALLRRERAAPPPGAQQTLPGEDAEELDAPESGPLGPAIGQSVDEYLTETRAKLNTIGVGSPDGTVVAVVSFDRYLTAPQVRELLGTTMQVQRVFFRVPTPNALMNDAPVQDIVRDTKAAYAAWAKQREKAAKEFLDFAKTIENDPAQKAEHEKDAALILQEVRALRSGTCKCVFAVVVRSRLRLLQDALNTRTIRAVDISALDAKTDRFTFTALLPSDKQIVTGGNAK